LEAAKTASKAKRKRARRKAQASRGESPRAQPAPEPVLKKQAPSKVAGKGAKGKRELPPYLRIVK
jgi:hypothetical protein